MKRRTSRWAASLLVVAAVLLIASRCWAVFIPLGPSQDDWGMKYEVKMTAADGDKVNILFTLVDEGRLKPIFTTTLVAFGDPGYDGSRTYLAQTPIAMKPTKEGLLVGQTQISKELIHRAQIRILTLTIDGKRQTSAPASYYISLKRFLDKTPAADSSATPASRPSSPAEQVPRSR